MKFPLPVGATVLAILAMVSADTFAIDFRFTDGPVVKPTPERGNPTIVVPVGGLKTVNLMAKRSGDSGFVNHVDFNILALSTDGGEVSGGFTVLNLHGAPTVPGGSGTRWDGSATRALNNGTGALLVSDFDVFTTSTVLDPPFAIADAYTPFGTLTIRPTHPGIVYIYLQVGPKGMSETSGVTTSTFGWGDTAIPNDPAQLSAVPDLMIIVPEPDTFAGIAVTAAIALLVIRRTRCVRQIT